MMYEFCAQTDCGLARDNNEDAVTWDATCGLAVLADGMGGYNAGEVASGMATAFIRAEMGRWLLKHAEGDRSVREVRQALELCVGRANHAVFTTAQTHPAYAGMGTTLVVGVFQQGRLVLGHMGDSRCYRWRGNTLLRLTRDHSFLQEQLDAGLITERQAAGPFNRNLVTRALGVEPSVELEVHTYSVEADDLYLMCSDGLSDMVNDRAIARILQSDLALEPKAAALVDAANAGGGRDNISVLLAKAGGLAGRRGLVARWLGT